MPEGHVLHRLADDPTADFAGRRVAVSSPQGRFASEALLLDGLTLERAGARGKHLFVEFADDRVVHIHLGLIGTMTIGPLRPVVGLDPLSPASVLSAGTWRAIWADLVTLMAEGKRLGRIDTVRPEHQPDAMGRPARQDDHGGEVYVYRRTDEPCLVCGTPIRRRELAGRNLFWCPTCQKGH